MPAPQTEGWRGRLLVATPPLTDPNFDRTVVLVLEHNEEGAVGVVLNRPARTDLEDALPEWRRLAAPPDRLFVGGPVAPTAVIALGRVPAVDDATREPSIADDGWVRVFADIGSVDVAREPSDIAVPVDPVRIFAGYSGWGPGQLEGEIAEGAWFVVDAEARDVFDADPATLWTRVLRRQRGRIAMFASCPADPAVN